MYLEIFVFTSILLYIFYKWSTKGFNTFKERGIPHKKPFPLIGNALPFLKKDYSLHRIMIELYKETKQHKVYGFYNFREPFFIVNDPELIKQMGVKDFDAFTNHQRLFNSESDPLLNGMLTVMKDQRWRNMRNTVTPIFTGAKLRAMFTLMNECFAETIKYLEQELHGGDSLDMEMKDCFSRLSIDLIATTAFGIKVNSFENKNNEFYTIGKGFARTRRTQAIKFMLYSFAPKLFKLLGITVIDKATANYFMRLVVDAMKYRERHNIVRPDMIQLLMEAQKESEHNWSQEDIVAQCFIFFFAAFQNNANLLCITCHELMENPAVQEKLYDEILDMQQALHGKVLDYEALQKMKYLDMVITEALRKWSLLALTDRECGASFTDYTVKDADGNFVCELKKGDRVWYQTIGFHWDEECFEHPEVFEPERFNEENKHKIKPFTYSPFGVGPRICIGNRYAYMQAKAMIYYLLKDFRLERSEQTCKNLFEDIRGFEIAPKSGFWLKLVKRRDN